MKNKTPLLFLTLSITALILGILFGLFSALQYVIPDFLKNYIPFSKMRPFHVTSVISWVILCATGSIYYFLTQVEKLNIYSNKLIKLHFIIFLLTGIGVYISFITGKMEGKEYLAYTPILTLPILIGWLMFGINYFKTVYKNVKMACLLLDVGNWNCVYVIPFM